MKRFSETGKRLFFFLMLLLLFVTQKSFSQKVNQYSFFQEMGTYTPIAGGSVVGDATNFFSQSGTNFTCSFIGDPTIAANNRTGKQTGDGFPIGFMFKYRGVDYNRFGVSTNGFIVVGNANGQNTGFSIGHNVGCVATLSSCEPYNGDPLEIDGTQLVCVSCTGVYQDETGFVNAISAFSTSMQGQPNSTLQYLTTGVAPNRVLIVQWSHYRNKQTGTYPDPNGDLNFQIKLYETSNKIEFAYGVMNSSSQAPYYGQVGLRGADHTDVFGRDWIVTNANYDYDQFDWTNTQKASSIDKFLEIDQAYTNPNNANNKNHVAPPPGLIYTFLPPSVNCTTPNAGAASIAKDPFSVTGIPSAFTSSVSTRKFDDIPAGNNQDKIVLNLTGFSKQQGLAVQWQQSIDNINFTNIAGATSSIYNTQMNYNYDNSPTTNTWYRAKVSCGANAAYSNTVSQLFQDAPVYAKLPYFQGFESWQNRIDVNDVPGKEWVNRPATGDNSWRRNDEGVSKGGWSQAGSYSGTQQSTEGTYSAQFQNKLGQGNNTPGFDLYVDLSQTGNKQLTFDYIAQNVQLSVLLSIDGGKTFTTLQSFPSGTSTGWTSQAINISAVTSTGVIRFLHTVNGSGFSIGLDNLKVIPPCTGTPAAGIINYASPLCPTLSLTDTSPASDLTFQWQQSSDNITWTNAVSGAGATTGIYNPPTLATATWYRANVTCPGSTLSSYSNTIQLPASDGKIHTLPYIETFDVNVVTPALPCLWINSSSAGGNWSTSNTLSAVKYPSNGAVLQWGAATNAWLFSPPLVLAKGKQYQVIFKLLNLTKSPMPTFTIGWGSSATAAAMTKTIYSSSTAVNTYQQFVTTYITPNAGTYYVGFNGVSTAAINMMLDDIIITEVCTGAPVAGTILTDANNFCNNGNANLTYSGLPANVYNTLQWQTSSDGNTWTDIAGATTVSFNTGTLTVNAYYRTTATCVSSGQSTNTPPLLIQVSNPTTPSISIATVSPATVHPGDQVVFTSASANGGATPIYTWNVNGADIVNSNNSTYSTTSLINGNNDVLVKLTSSSTCVTSATASSNTLHINVDPTQTIVFNPLPVKTFGDVPFQLSATGGASGKPVTFSSDNAIASISNNTLTISGAGTATITAHQAGTASFTAATDVPQVLTINKATQTISFNLLPTKNTGDAPFQLSASGGTSGNPITFSGDNDAVATVSADMVTIHSAGGVNITASQAGNTNYLAASDVIRKLTVVSPSLKNQSITFAPLAAKNVGDAPFDLVASSDSGLGISYASSTPTVATIAGNTVTVLAAGVTKITASQGGDSNYNPAQDVTQTLIVSSPNNTNQLITFNTITDKLVGDPSFDLSTIATTNSGLPITFTTNDDEITINGAQATIVKAGHVTITASQDGNASYNPAAEVQQSFCINPAKPVVTQSLTNPLKPVLSSSSPQGNQWYLDGVIISGATNQSIAADQYGQYTVKVTAETCSSSFSDALGITTGIADKETLAFVVHPNPAQDVITITIHPPAQASVSVSIINAEGKILLSGNRELLNQPINVAQFSAGIYFVKVLVNNAKAEGKFIKK